MNSENGHFMPAESIAFEKLLSKMRKVSALFGFIPHNMSVFEDVDVMKEQTGIKQIYRVEDPTGRMNNVGLRVDHTVSLAYFVAQNKNHTAFPFKRCTTNPIYRPLGNNGYVESYACDVDTIAREKLPLVFDAEIIAFIKDVLVSSGLKDTNGSPIFSIHINNRKIINGLMNLIGIKKDDTTTVRNAIGNKNIDIIKELVNTEQVTAIQNFLAIDGENSQKIAKLKEMFGDSCAEGIQELVYVYEQSLELGVHDRYITINPHLVRGMEYYTGFTCCAFLQDNENVKICYGGRYRIPKVTNKGETFPGVGMTINLTALFKMLVDMKIISVNTTTIAPVMVSANSSLCHAMYIAKRLREKYIQVEVFLDQGMSIEDQIAHAESRGFKLFVWTKDNGNRPLRAEDTVCLKNLTTMYLPHQEYACSGVFGGINIGLKRRIE